MFLTRRSQFQSLISKLRYKYDTFTSEQYFLNQRDANLSRYTLDTTLKPLLASNQGPENSGDTVTVTGLPYGTAKDSVPEYDKWSQISTIHHPDLVFLQIDPSPYLARQRFLAHKCALNELDDYDKRDIVQIDPLKPHAWEECVVNKIVLDMLDKNLDFEKLDYSEGFATYAYPEVQEKLITEQNKQRFIDSITKNIVHRKFSPYHTINTILYTALLTKHRVILGDMPEQLLRVQLGNTLELQEAKDLFKYVLMQVKEMKFKTSFKKATMDLLPHVFQAPRDLFMTAMLKEAFQGAQTITAFVGLHHYNPIVNYWQPGPHGINYTEASRIPQRIRGETDEQLIEKQALIEVMLESTCWAEPFISNPFPYLVQDITKVNQSDLGGMKKTFFDYYQKYSAFKLQTQKELTYFHNDKDIIGLEHTSSLLSLPEYNDVVNVKAFQKQQEQQRTSRFKIQQLKI